MIYQDIIKNVNILLVDDDKDYLNMTSAFLKQMGYNIDIADGGGVALEKLNSKNYQILLLDFYMPDMTGEQVIEKVRKKNQEIIIILQTGFSGQNPPAQMLKRLNIQNYFDKTEGISRLELEIISAVRIVNQQNEIELTKYKNSAMGDLMVSIASEIKQVLLSVSAGIEATNLISSGNEKISDMYNLNKKSLEKVDRILNAILTSANSENILSDEEVVTVVDAIAKNIAREYNVLYKSKVALKSSGYMKGRINDSLFIVCAILKQAIICSEKGEEVTFVITDDEQNWYFNIDSKSIKNIDKNKLYSVYKVISAIQELEISYEDDKITLQIKK